MTLAIAFDALSGVDGSARFTFGSTIALASVSGPITPRLAAEHPVRATIDIHVRPLSAVPSTSEKHAAIALKGVLERACILAQHPRTSIQVVVQALSPSSSISGGKDMDQDVHADVRLAAQVNAASLALLNAGSIPMRGVVCAVAVAQPQSASTSASPSAAQPQLVADPSHARDDTCPTYISTGCFAFLFGVDQDASSGANGVIPPAKTIWTNYRARPGHAFSPTALAQAEKVALEGAVGVWTVMKESLGAGYGLSSS